jgi:hypothetical protein
MMKWLQWTPDRNGVVGVIFAAIIVVAIFAFFVMYFPDFQQRRASAGFGPDWECTVQPKAIPFVSRSRAGDHARLVIPVKAGIQYAAASRFNNRVTDYWITRLRG